MNIDKSALRKQMKINKAALTPQEKAAESRLVWQHIEALPCFVASSHILLYHSLPDELPTHEVIDRWHTMGKTIYLPVVVGDDLVVRRYTPQAMQQGEFNIWEPIGNEIDTDIIELIIVPGVAFDRQGNRLGRGKGYYDRLLSRTNATCIGVCYKCQLAEYIPAEAHDRAMHYIATAEGFVKAL